MIGRLEWSRKRRLRPRWNVEWAMGMRLVRMELPGDGRGKHAQREWERGIELLRRMGVGPILPPEEWESALPEERTLSTRGLWQSVAVPLVLDVLERGGSKRERAVVGLAGERVTPQFLQLCRELALQVRGLSLDVTQGGDALIWRLERSWGIPVFRGGGDVNLLFTPNLPLCGQNIPLYQHRPKPPGYDLILRQGLERKDLAEVEHLSMLSLLLEHGRIAPEDLQLCYHSEKSGHTTAEVMIEMDPFEQMKRNGSKKLPLELMPTCSNVVSANECTGLMPTLPENEAELEAYQELSSLEVPKQKALKQVENTEKRAGQ